MDDLGKSATEKTITFVIREEDFDVRGGEGVTMQDIYVLAVSLLQHLEDIYDEGSSIYGATMLQ